MSFTQELFRVMEILIKKLINKTLNEVMLDEGWGSKLLTGAALAAGLAGGIKGTPANAQTPMAATRQNNVVLAHVSGPQGKESVQNPDLDMVHGVLGSKRLTDDFERRVTAELMHQYKLGNNAMVSNLRITTKVIGAYIVTDSNCDIILSSDGNAYTIFTTRGSIGSNYSERHDQQVSGLVERLEGVYGGEVQVLGPYTIGFDLNGQHVSYKQSFFMGTDKTRQANSTATTSGKNQNQVIAKTISNADYSLLGKAAEREISAEFSKLGGGMLKDYQISYDAQQSVFILRYTVTAGKYTGFTRRGNAQISANPSVKAETEKNAKEQVESAVTRIQAAGYQEVVPMYNVGNGGNVYNKNIGNKFVSIFEVPILLR